MNTYNKFKVLGAMAAFCAALGVASMAKASITPAGKISEVRIMGTSFVVITLVNTASFSRPACHVGWSKSYAFDVSNSKGRAMLATAQAARLAGKDIYIEGGSSCTNTGSATIETVQVMSF